MSTIPEAFSRNLFRLREQKRLTQQELADLAEISRGSIARYESGEGGATLNTIAKLAKALGVEETDLVSESRITAEDYKTFYELSQKSEKLRDRLERLEERDKVFVQVLDIIEKAHHDGSAPNLDLIHKTLMEFMNYPYFPSKKSEVKTELEALLNSFDERELKLILQGAKAVKDRRASSKKKYEAS